MNPAEKVEEILNELLFGADIVDKTIEGRVWCGFESKKLLHIFHLLV